MADITEAPANTAPVATKKARTAWYVNRFELIMNSFWLGLFVVILLLSLFTLDFRVVAGVLIPVCIVGLIWNARYMSEKALGKCIDDATC